MMKATQKQARETDSGKNRKGGVIISIDSFRNFRQVVPASQPRNATTVVSQVRLAAGLELHKQEMRIAQALRDFRLQMEADLAAGSEIEGGDLAYDPELKIVRRKITNANLRG